tara:strand:- start:123 stop:1043 length:921 start_codon:yes stop_codon:yes gene_type:complete
MTTINTNIAATLTANALAKNQRVMSQAMERLSSGVRISSAADDAAGLAISSRLTSQIRGLDQAVRNTNDAISMIQTADGAIAEAGSMLQRMRVLVVSAATGTITTAQRSILYTEFDALTAQIDSIATDTQWNGRNILDGSLGAVNFQVGANANQTISITFADLNVDFGATEASQAGINGSTAADLDIFTNLNVTAAGTTSGDETIDLEVLGPATADATTLGYLDTAIARVSSHRATLGATINRLEYAADNLTNISQNSKAARSQIMDTDYAAETTKLARTQIIQQAGVAVLTQANQHAKSVLSLLQ